MLTQALCNSFKPELLKGLHNFSAAGGNLFKAALYTSAATLDKTTTVYVGTGEVPAGSGYTTGGNPLTNNDPALFGDTAICDFADPTWPNSNFTTRGTLIYNSTNGNRAVMVLDFGSDRTVQGGTFTIQFPTPDGSNAVLRLT